MAGFDPFQNLNLNKFFGLPNYDQMLTQKAIEDAKKKETAKKPKLLGGDNAVMKAAPPKAVMKAAPKELLGGPDAKIEPGWQEQWKNQRDANTKAVFGPIQDAFNNVVLGDWYDPDHQTVAYKALHPKVDPADAAIKGNVINKMVLQNHPNPQPAKAVATQEQVAKGKPVPVAQQQVPANQNQIGKQVNIPANADQKGSFVPVATDPQTGAELHVDPQTGDAVINDKQTGTVVPVSNTATPQEATPAVQAQTDPQFQGKSMQTMDDLKIQQNDALAKQQEAYTKLRPIIQKQYGLTDDQMTMLDNNIPLPPPTPWAVAHPVAAMLSNVFSGLGQAGFASINGGNLGANMITGLGKGTSAGINSVVDARDTYNTDKYKANAALGNQLETSRMYANRVPGLGVATGKSIDDLEKYLGGLRSEHNQENLDRANYNDSGYALDGNLKPGDIMGDKTQADALANRNRQREMTETDAQAAKLNNLLNKVLDNENYQVTGDDLAGLSPAQKDWIISNLKDPVKREALKQSKQQTIQNDLTIKKTQQELDSNKPFDPANADGDAGWNVLKSEMARLKHSFTIEADPKKKEALRQQIIQLENIGEVYQNPKSRQSGSIESEMIKKFFADKGYVFAPKSAGKSGKDPLGLGL